MSVKFVSTLTPFGGRGWAMSGCVKLVPVIEAAAVAPPRGRRQASRLIRIVLPDHKTTCRKTRWRDHSPSSRCCSMAADSASRPVAATNTFCFGERFCLSRNAPNSAR